MKKLVFLLALCTSCIFAQKNYDVEVVPSVSDNNSKINVTGIFYEMKTAKILPIGFVILEGTDSKIVVGEDASFHLEMEPGKYRFAAYSLGFESIITENIKLKAGYSYEIRLSFEEKEEFMDN